MQAKPQVWEKIAKRLLEVTGQDAAEFFSSPANYSGKAKEKALDLAQTWIHRMDELKNSLEIN
jgi:hypothetical protein